MRSPAVRFTWIVGILLAAAGCDDPAGITGVDSVRSGTSAERIAEVNAVEGTVYQLGEFALYMPAAAEGPRAVLVALGGPNTKAFVTGEPFGAPLPPVEAALQAMGQSLRDLADEHHFAILGTSRAALPSGAESDQIILDAIEAGAEASGRAALPSVPLLMYAISGGAPEASGFVVRNPERVAGLLFKVPLTVPSFTTATQLRIPTMMILAEFDAFVNNTELAQSFADNRGSGGLWALALEPGVPHHALSPNHRDATLEWIGAIMNLGVAGASGNLRTMAEQSGWLGNPSTGDVTPWGGYTGDRSRANWFPTRSAAERWQSLIGAGAP